MVSFPFQIAYSAFQQFVANPVQSILRTIPLLQNLKGRHTPISDNPKVKKGYKFQAYFLDSKDKIWKQRLNPLLPISNMKNTTNWEIKQQEGNR